MISKKIEDALNQQINNELYSSYLYLSMEAYFTSVNLSGFANWMMVQTKEELAHVTKLYDFINERGGRITLKAIAAPPTDWKSPLEVFQAVYKHEQTVTGLINELVNLAIEQKDHATNSFLRWFVDEQVEEENNVNSVLSQVTLIKDSPQALFMLDKELANRVFTPPAAERGA